MTDPVTWAELLIVGAAFVTVYLAGVGTGAWVWAIVQRVDSKFEQLREYVDRKLNGK